ncbi:MAG: PQQ-binding-like beta-propeller repeat protein [Planctomycetota bacterium]
MSKHFALLSIALVLGLLGACASDESETMMTADDGHMMALDDVTNGMSDVDPTIARMRALEAQVEGIAGKKAWSARFGGGGTITRAWLSGSHLVLEIRGGRTGQTEIQDIDVRTGEARWITVVGPNALDRAPTDGDGGMALITARDNGLTVVNDVTGGRFFNVRTQLAPVPSSDPVAVGPTFYMGDQLSGKFAAVSAASGNVGWYFESEGRCVSAPVLTHGMPRQLVVFGTNTGWIYGVPAKAADGVPPDDAAWAHDLGGSFTAAPNFAMVGDEENRQSLVVFPGKDGWLYGCDAATGRRNWVLRTNAPFSHRASIIGGRVYARNSERFFCVDGTTGQRAWWPESAEGRSEYERSQLFEAPEGFELADRALAANGDRVILLSGANRLMRCNAESGKIESETTLGGFDFFLTNEVTGALVVGTRDGIFMAYE